MRILESSQTLLHVLKKEDTTLTKKKYNVTTRKVKDVSVMQQSPPEKKPALTNRYMKTTQCKQLLQNVD